MGLRGLVLLRLNRLLFLCLLFFVVGFGGVGFFVFGVEAFDYVVGDVESRIEEFAGSKEENGVIMAGLVVLGQEVIERVEEFLLLTHGFFLCTLLQGAEVVLCLLLFFV